MDDMAQWQPNDLVQYLVKLRGQKDDAEAKPLRFAIYCRKSTDDKEMQQRSLPDQVIECQQIADARELQICKVVTESESAKKPNIRPKFCEMLDEIKKGKYDDILSWHPDSLAEGQLINKIKQLWQLRLQGKTLESIAEYLNDSRYSQPTAVSG